MAGDPSHVLGPEVHLGLANIVCEWNALDEVESLAVQCGELVDLAKSRSGIGADLLQARLLIAGSEYQQAAALLARATATNKTGLLTDRRRDAANLQISQRLRHGEVVAAAGLARAHQLPLGLAKTLLAQGQSSQALETIQDHRRTMHLKPMCWRSASSMLLVQWT